MPDAMSEEWIRIPAPIESDTDRRMIVGILTAAGLETRIVKVKLTKNGSYKRYVEYRQQACGGEHDEGFPQAAARTPGTQENIQKSAVGVVRAVEEHDRYV